MKTRLVMVTSGCDWSDAGYSHMMIPEGVDLDNAQSEYWKWYREVFQPNYPKIKCIHFPEWLEKNYDCKFIEVEEYHES